MAFDVEMLGAPWRSRRGGVGDPKSIEALHRDPAQVSPEGPRYFGATFLPFTRRRIIAQTLAVDVGCRGLCYA